MDPEILEVNSLKMKVLPMHLNHSNTAILRIKCHNVLHSLLSQQNVSPTISVDLISFYLISPVRKFSSDFQEFVAGNWYTSYIHMQIIFLINHQHTMLEHCQVLYQGVVSLNMGNMTIGVTTITQTRLINFSQIGYYFYCKNL